MYLTAHADAIVGGAVGGVLALGLIVALTVAAVVARFVFKRKTVPSKCLHACVVNAIVYGSMCPNFVCCAGSTDVASKAPNAR